MAAQQPPAVAVRVARTPAQYSEDQPLNFAERNDIAIFNKGCEPLEGDKYDGAKLKVFLARLQVKAEKFNWKSQGMLTCGAHNSNLLTQYGEITMNEVKTAAELYQPLLDRQCQNSTMMFQCIMDSITPEVFAKVSTSPERYRITIPAAPAQGNQPARPAEIVNDGPFFLKAIIDNNYAYTATNVVLARRNLANLRDHIKIIPEFNIITFHLYAKEQLQELEAANETTNDLLVNLFSAYREVTDRQFRGYVQPIQDRHYDGKETQNANGLTLMTTIENYYKGMVKDGVWMKPDPDHETVIALKAQLFSQQKEEGKKMGKRDGKKDDKWKTTPPKKGESGKKVVTINGKKVTYYWCPHHGRYMIHKPQDCKKKQEEQKKKEEPKPEPKKSSKDDKGLALRVMNTILASDSDGSVKSESESE
jgi:hypothetical protein